LSYPPQAPTQIILICLLKSWKTFSPVEPAYYTEAKLNVKLYFQSLSPSFRCFAAGKTSIIQQHTNPSRVYFAFFQIKTAHPPAINSNHFI
ncbi:hypothetical protein ACPZRF_04265, partial [Alkalicoccus sp. WONF2802]